MQAAQPALYGNDDEKKLNHHARAFAHARRLYAELVQPYRPHKQLRRVIKHINTRQVGRIFKRAHIHKLQTATPAQLQANNHTNHTTSLLAILVAYIRIYMLVNLLFI